MADLFWLNEGRVQRISPFFRSPTGGRPAYRQRLLHVIRKGLRWRDTPAEYGPHKTLYNRFIRWSRMGVFNRIFAGLAGRKGQPDPLMIDAAHLKAHRTAASLLKKGLYPAVSGAPRAA